jgi:hypothetical protein
MPKVGERVIVKITRYIPQDEKPPLKWVSPVRPAWVVAELVDCPNYDVDCEKTLLCDGPPPEEEEGWDGFMLLRSFDTYEILSIDEAPEEVRAALVALELREAANME